MLYVLTLIALAGAVLMTAGCADHIPQAAGRLRWQVDPIDANPSLSATKSWHTQQASHDRLAELLVEAIRWRAADSTVVELRERSQSEQGFQAMDALALTLSADDAEWVYEVADVTAAQLGHKFEQYPVIRLISLANLRKLACIPQYIAEWVPDQMRERERGLSRFEQQLGIRRPDLSTRDIQRLVTPGIAGWYYSPGGEPGEIVLVTEPPVGRSWIGILSHELMHALQDQLMGYALDEVAIVPTTEAADIRRWVIEGDASASSLSPDHPALSEVVDSRQWQQQQPILAVAPNFLRLIQQHLLDQEVLSAPYIPGRQSIAALRARRGQEAVDHLLVGPPQTMEQLMHPEKLDSGELPIEWVGTYAPAGAWQRMDHLSEYYLYQFLRTRQVSPYANANSTTGGPAPNPFAEAAAGWGNDELTAWLHAEDPQRTLVVWRLGRPILQRRPTHSASGSLRIPEMRLELPFTIRSGDGIRPAARFA